MTAKGSEYQVVLHEFPQVFAGNNDLRAALTTTSKKYMALTIQGIDDKVGFDLVHKARMVVSGTRIAIDKRRKILNEEAQSVIKKNNAEGSELLDIIEPVETYLKGLEKEVEDEKQLRKEEAALLEQDKLRDRVRQLTKAGMVFDGVDCKLDNISISTVDISRLTEVEFQKIVDNATEIHQRILAEKESVLQAELLEEARKTEARLLQEAEDRKVKLLQEEAEKETKLLEEKRQVAIRQEQELEAERLWKVQEGLIAKEAELAAKEKALNDKLLADALPPVLVIQEEPGQAESQKMIQAEGSVRNVWTVLLEDIDYLKATTLTTSEAKQFHDSGFNRIHEVRTLISKAIGILKAMPNER